RMSRPPPILRKPAAESSAVVKPAVAAAIGTRVEEPLPVIPKLPARDPKAVIDDVNGALQDIFFEYNRSDLRPGSLAGLQQNAALVIPILREFPRVTLLIDGHCDERGSAEYNLGLGGHRAGRTAEILRGLGVPASQLRTVSYGKEMPQCI